MAFETLETFRIFETLRNSELPPYVVIEGNTGTGKSTLLSGMRRCGYPTISEYHEFLDGDNGERFPLFPPPDIGAVLHSNELWVLLEARRLMKRLSLSRESGGGHIMDRSPVSLLAFEYAKQKAGFPADFRNLSRRLLKLYANNILQEPQGYIFLKCGNSTIRQRREGSVLPFLIEQITTDAIDQYIERFLKVLVPLDRFLILDTAELSTDQVLTISIDFTTNCFALPVRVECMQVLLAGILKNLEL